MAKRFCQFKKDNLTKQISMTSYYVLNNGVLRCKSQTKKVFYDIKVCTCKLQRSEDNASYQISHCAAVHSLHIINKMLISY